jgi:hypothetical protein
VVFELVRNAGWAEKILYNFSSVMYDGNNTLTSVIFDAGGNLYGTTGTGAYSFGTIFELMPQTTGNGPRRNSAHPTPSATRPAL